VRRYPLCRADGLVEGATRGFVLGTGSERHAVFVLRHNGIVRAYRNACPHQGTPLELMPDAFFDDDRRFLICRTHGARFRPDDGLCVDGPCIGQSLTAAPLRNDGGMLVLEDAD
jgi:naringenin degradation protein FdeD